MYLTVSEPSDGQEALVYSTVSRTPHQMVELGKIVGEQLFDGAIVGLTGPLGAGKTTLARGIAEGMGLDDGYIVSSPTYTLMQIYPCGPREMCHLDLYRIEGVDDLDSTGYRDATAEGRVLVVEWPEKEPSVLSPEHLAIDIDYLGDGSSDGGSVGRKVTFRPAGERYVSMIEKVRSLTQYS